jgi:DnaJ-class molecular chaperone
MNCFQILGLPDDADIKMVGQRWKELALTHHPDVGGDSETFQALREAYTEAREIAPAPVCRTCKGSGKVRSGSGFSFTTYTCPDCGGTGDQNAS